MASAAIRIDLDAGGRGTQNKLIEYLTMGKVVVAHDGIAAISSICWLRISRPTVLKLQSRRFVKMRWAQQVATPSCQLGAGDPFPAAGKRFLRRSS